MNSLRDTLRISLAGLAIGAFALSGCVETSSNKEDAHDHSGHDHDGHDHDHGGHDHGSETAQEVRVDLYEGIIGELKFIPEDGDTKTHPQIRHVQIPDFKKDDGTIAMTPDGIPGMRSMKMEFPLAEGVTLDGFEVGDKVMFDFVVNWGGKVPWELTKIEKLDPSTEIDYSNAKAEDLEP